MIDADLEQFAFAGVLGPFDSTSTRSQIEQLLGAPDADSYPDFATYGHVSFDLAGSAGPPCRIQIAFPHFAVVFFTFRLRSSFVFVLLRIEAGGSTNKVG